MISTNATYDRAAALAILKSATGALARNDPSIVSDLHTSYMNEGLARNPIDNIRSIILANMAFFSGTDRDDWILAKNGSVIDAGGGNNSILGISNNTIRTGSGNDWVGGVERNVINAGDGDNYVFAGDENTVKSGNGNDIIRVLWKNAVDAGNGNNVIQAGMHNSIKTGSGNDFVFANGYNVLDVGEGDNRFFLNASNTVTAGSGNDDVFMNAGNTLFLGDGNNSVFGNAANRITTGNGKDSIWVNSQNTVFTGAGDDDISGNSENFIDAGDGDDRIISDGIIFGGAGNDTIGATRSHSIISGGKGNDNIITGNGAIVRYDVGDGSDLISIYDTPITLELGNGISQEETTLSVTGNKLIISFTHSKTDKIEVSFLKEIMLAFADGTKVSVLPGEGAAQLISNEEMMSIISDLTSSAYREF